MKVQKQSYERRQQSEIYSLEINDVYFCNKKNRDSGINIWYTGEGLIIFLYLYMPSPFR